MANTPQYENTIYPLEPGNRSKVLLAPFLNISGDWTRSCKDSRSLTPDQRVLEAAPDGHGRPRLVDVFKCSLERSLPSSPKIVHLMLAGPHTHC